MQLKQPKLAILLLLPILLIGSHLRHIQIVQSVPQCQYVISIDDTDMELINWEKTLQQPAHQITTARLITPPTLDSIDVCICILLILVLCRRKSHIEYCGKKMAKAIVLQFHPRQRPV